MENKAPQFKLLEFLEETGIAKERNISDFIIESFDKPTVRISNEEDKAVQFLQSMLRRELIQYNKGQLANINGRYISTAPTPADLPKWFDEEIVMGNITIGGLEYLYLQKMNNSIISSNDIISANSTTQTTILKGQRSYLYITALLTLANVLITVINLKSNDLKDKLQTQLQEQTKQIHKLQIELSEATNLHFQELKATKTLPKKN